jgi:hypothetical protein
MLEQRFSERTVAAQHERIVGHAARFNEPARVVVNGRVVTERIMPGAFAKSLAEKRDVLCFMDHDPSRVLGRRSNGTLELREDALGLWFSVKVADTSYGRDALALAARGDLGGGSFGFRATRETWNADKTERTVHEADLFEVSVIAAVPAYATTVQARAQATPEPVTARQRRLRLIDIGGAS